MTGGIQELAGRVEAATGPDREIDKEIYYEILGFCPHANTVRSGAQSDTGFDCVDCGADSWGNLGKFGQRLHDGIPAYTASIDAAMTLVPDGWRVANMGETVIEGDDPWQVRLLEKRFDGRAKVAVGDGSSPALALCAAALRALASMQEGAKP